MRYVVAIIVSGILIATIWLSMYQLERTLKDFTWQKLVMLQQRGEIPADAELEHGDFAVEMTDFHVWGHAGTTV